MLVQKTFCAQVVENQEILKTQYDDFQALKNATVHRV